MKKQINVLLYSCRICSSMLFVFITPRHHIALPCTEHSNQNNSPLHFCQPFVVAVSLPQPLAFENGARQLRQFY